MLISTQQNRSERNGQYETEELFSARSQESDGRFDIGIAADHAGAIFQELADLSSNRGAYVVRELVSNAYDATVAAGDASLPVEIEFMRPQCGKSRDGISYRIAELRRSDDMMTKFRITDHGVGMSQEDIEYFYQYGGSDKVGTSSIGSKGLGAKSPLAVASSFKIVTRHDGIETHAIISRGADKDYGEVLLSRPCPVDDTGTTIEFDVSDRPTLEQMSACVSGIVSYNINMNLVVNGRNVSSLSDIRSSYVLLGNVTIGTDESGCEIAPRVWQHVDAFPYTFGRHHSCSADGPDGSVCLDIAGYLYELVEPWHPGNTAMVFSPNSGIASDRTPSFVVEFIPGLVNFTISRDEIKMDDAFRNLRRALFFALRNIESADVTEHVVRLAFGDGNGSLRNTLEWMHQNGFGYLLAQRDGTYALATYAKCMADTYTMEIPQECLLFHDDGGRTVDCTPVLCGESEYPGFESRFAVVAHSSNSYSCKLMRSRIAQYAEERGDEKLLESLRWSREENSPYTATMRKNDVIGLCQSALEDGDGLLSVCGIFSFSPYENGDVVVVHNVDNVSSVLDFVRKTERMMGIRHGRQYGTSNVTLLMDAGHDTLTQDERYVIENIRKGALICEYDDVSALVSDIEDTLPEYEQNKAKGKDAFACRLLFDADDMVKRMFSEWKSHDRLSDLVRSYDSTKKELLDDPVMITASEDVSGKFIVATDRTCTAAEALDIMRLVALSEANGWTSGADSSLYVVNGASNVTIASMIKRGATLFADIRGRIKKKLDSVCSEHGVIAHTGPRISYRVPLSALGDGGDTMSNALVMDISRATDSEMFSLMSLGKVTGDDGVDTTLRGIERKIYALSPIRNVPSIGWVYPSDGGCASTASVVSGMCDLSNKMMEAGFKDAYKRAHARWYDRCDRDADVSEVTMEDEQTRAMFEAIDAVAVTSIGSIASSAVSALDDDGAFAFPEREQPIRLADANM